MSITWRKKSSYVYIHMCTYVYVLCICSIRICVSQCLCLCVYEQWGQEVRSFICRPMIWDRLSQPLRNYTPSFSAQFYVFLIFHLSFTPLSLLSLFPQRAPFRVKKSAQSTKECSTSEKGEMDIWLQSALNPGVSCDCQHLSSSVNQRYKNHKYYQAPTVPYLLTRKIWLNWKNLAL